MKFQIHIKILSDPPQEYWETYVKDISDPEAYGRDVVEYWNRTLRSIDKPREYLGYKIISQENKIDPHDWVPTKKQGEKEYYLCNRCGIKGIRHTLYGDIEFSKDYCN